MMTRSLGPKDQVDVHSVLSIATHTLDDIGDDLVQPPAPESVSPAASNGLQTDPSEEEEKPTVAFAVPAGLLVSENINTETAPLDVKQVALESIDGPAEDGAAAGELDERGDSVDASVRILGSVDIDSSTHDPAYLEQAAPAPDISGPPPKRSENTPNPEKKKSLTFPPSADVNSSLGRESPRAAVKPVSSVQMPETGTGGHPPTPVPAEAILGIA